MTKTSTATLQTRLDLTVETVEPYDGKTERVADCSSLVGD
jgi:hypothetical protein